LFQDVPESPVREMKFNNNGQMPQIVKDKDILHVVFGSGDSILYTYSSDHGKSFFLTNLNFHFT